MFHETANAFRLIVPDIYIEFLYYVHFFSYFILSCELWIFNCVDLWFFLYFLCEILQLASLHKPRYFFINMGACTKATGLFLHELHTCISFLL